MRIDQAGALGTQQVLAEGAREGGQFLKLLLQQVGAGGGQLVLLLAHQGTGAHHLLGQRVACRAAQGLLSARSPHQKLLVLPPVTHQGSGAHNLLRWQETHLGAPLILQTAWGNRQQHQHYQLRWQVMCSSTALVWAQLNLVHNRTLRLTAAGLQMSTPGSPGTCREQQGSPGCLPL